MDYHQPNFYKLNDDSTFLISKLSESMNKTNSVTILDLCAGCGFLGIETANLLKEKSSLTFVEIQNEFLAYIQQNTSLLKYDCEVNILHQSFEETIKGEFDYIVCNPPYFEKEDSRVSKNIQKAISRHFVYGNLDSLISIIIKKLKNKDSMGFVLIRKDHKKAVQIKEKYQAHIKKIYSKSKVELIVIQNK